MSNPSTWGAGATLVLLLALVAGVASDPSTWVPGATLFLVWVLFVAPLVRRRPARSSTKHERRKIALPLVVTAGIFLLGAFVFWPVLSIFWQGMRAVGQTQRIESALTDPHANLQRALFELARTEQRRKASYWMTPQLRAATDGPTTWATLLRDWCSVANLANTPSVCDRAVEVFPSLDADGPCPADLHPFVGTPEEVAAGFGIQVLPPSVEALRASTAGLIDDRCDDRCVPP